MGESSVMGSIVTLAVGTILVGAIGFVGVNLILDTTLTNASTSVKTILQTVVPILIGIAYVLVFLKASGVKLRI